MRALGLDPVDLGEAFRSWDGEPIFRAADTHWGTGGMRVAAEEIVRWTGLAVGPEARFGDLFEREGPMIPRPGDLMRKLGLKPRPSDERNFDNGRWAVGLPAISPEELSLSMPLLVGTSFSADGFVKFLAHYLGQPVRAEAEGGMTTFQVLERALRIGDRAGAVPSIVFAELPNYQLLRLGQKPDWWTFPAGFANAMAALLPAEVVKVDSSRRFLDPRLQVGEMLPPKDTVTLSEIGSGELCRSGDGVLEFDIDLEVIAGGGTIIVDSGTMRAYLPLKPGRQRLVIPLLDDRGLASRVRLYINGNGGFAARLHGFDLVSAGRRTEGTTVLADEQGSPLEQTVVWGAPRRVEAGDAVHLTRDGCAALGQAQIQCYLNDATVGRPWDVEQLEEGAPVVLALGAIAGQDFDRVKVLARSRTDEAMALPLVGGAFLSGVPSVWRGD